MIKMSNIPPPPPPPTVKPKSSHKTLLAAVVVVIIVVAVVVGAYVVMNMGSSPSNNNPTPNPSATSSPSGQTTTGPTTSATQTGQTSSPQTSQTPSSTATSPQTTASPSGSQGIANLRAGAWVIYTEKIYDDDGVTVISESQNKDSVSEGSPTQGAHVGENCLILTTETIASESEEGTDSKTMMYFAKGTMQAVRYEMWMNGELFMGQDIDPSNGTSTPTTGQIDPNLVISTEDVTVPAGSFVGCMKAKTTTTFEGRTIESYMWAHQSVPVWGLVKSTSYVNGVLQSLMELTSYGG